MVIPALAASKMLLMSGIPPTRESGISTRQLADQARLEIQRHTITMERIMAHSLLEQPERLEMHLILTGLMIKESDGQGVTGITTLSSGTWYYVVGTWDGSNRTIYLNGLPDGTNSYSGSIVPDSRAVYIGGRSGSDLSDGIIDEVRVSNVRRSA